MFPTTGSLDSQHPFALGPELLQSPLPFDFSLPTSPITKPSSTMWFFLKQLSGDAISLLDCLGSVHGSLLMFRMKFNFYFHVHGPHDLSLSYSAASFTTSPPESFLCPSHSNRLFWICYAVPCLRGITHSVNLLSLLFPLHTSSSFF